MGLGAPARTPIGRSRASRTAARSGRRSVAPRAPASQIGDNGRVKILVCDDHALFRAGLLHVLGELDSGVRLLEAGSGAETLATAREHPDLDLVLLDLDLGDASGLDLLAELRRHDPALPVVMVSASDDPASMRAAIDGGAAGFVPKSSRGGVLLGVLRLVLGGGVYIPPEMLRAPVRAAEASGPPRRRRRRAGSLTGRQEEVLELLARGLTNREICGVLGIAEGTVKAHLAAIFEALDVTNRTEAAFALQDLRRDGKEPKGRD